MKQLIKRYPALTFLALTVVWSWTYWVALFGVMPIDPEQGPTVAHVALAFLGASPSVFGILLTMVIDGREGLKELFSRTVRWRVLPIWYAAALLVIPAIYGLSYVVQGLLGGPLAPINVVEKLALGIPTALIACLLEEFGWRGFALPRLQRRYSALVSALVVGVGWALWHACLNYLVVAHQYGTLAIPILILLALAPVGQTVVMAWIHNNTRESMLLMLLCHFGIASSAILFSLPGPTTGVDELRNALVSAAVHWLVVIAIIAATGAKGLVRESRRDQRKGGG